MMDCKIGISFFFFMFNLLFRRIKLGHYVGFPFFIDMDKYLDITVQKDSQKQFKEEDQNMEEIQDNLSPDIEKEIAVLKKHIAQLTKAIEDVRIFLI